MSEMSATIVTDRPQVIVRDGELHLDVIAPPRPEVTLDFTGIQGGGPFDVKKVIKQHEQSLPSKVWVFNHNLGRKPAAVSVLTTGFVEMLADIVHISDNQLRVLFEQPTDGFVRAM